MTAASDDPLAALRGAGWNVPAPPSLTLADGERVDFRAVLRWLPGRRLSGVAEWQGRVVFAKLFFGAGAARYAQREQAGLAALTAAGLPTPAVLAVSELPDAVLLLSEYLDGATTLEAALEGADDSTPHLVRALALLGRLHGAGLVHDDLHPGNFLFHDGTPWLIDGDGVHAASPAQCIDNLALFLSQLPAADDGQCSALLAAYARPVDATALDAAVTAWRQRRLRRFLAKTLRNCTQFAVDRTARHFSARLRAADEMLAPLLADPDAALAAGRLLKDGGTCTVAALETDVVIKRYNLKHWRHALSRAWRPSRAWHAWLAGHRLAFYGIATPPPLALLEERRGPLRGRAFLLTGWCPGDNLLNVLEAGQEPPPPLAHAIESLFAVLHRLRITHGDLKATNLLWHAGRLFLIDLDATVEHRSAAAFRRAWRRDRARFLRNWPADSPLCRWLDARLPGV